MKKRFVEIIVSAFWLIVIIMYAVQTQYNIENNRLKRSPMSQKEEVVGSNLNSVGHSAEGNGCVYTTNRRYYGNEQEDNNMTIYRTKEKQWEVVVSYPEPSLSGLLDGSYTKLIHCQKPGHCARTGRDFAVGGGSLYWVEDRNGIRAIFCY